MNFQISEAGTRLQQRSRRLAADFATRAAGSAAGGVSLLR